MRLSGAVLCALLMHTLLHCQPLEEWVRRALERNPTREALQERWRSLRARIVPAGTVADPMIMVGVQNAPVGHAFRTEPMAMVETGVAWRLAIPSYYALHRQQAASDAELAASELEEYQRWLRAAVTQTYAELWESQQHQRLLRYAFQLLAQLDTVVATHIATGGVGQRAFFRLQLERTRLRLELEQEHERFATRRALLAALIGEERLDTVFLPEELPLPSTIAPRAILYRRLQEHPRLRGARADSLRAAAALSLSRLWVFPEIEVRLGYSYRPAPMEPAGSRSLWSFGLQVMLPLWSGQRQRPLAEAAFYDVQSRAAAVRARPPELATTLEQLLARWESLSRQEMLYREQLLLQAEHLWSATTAEYAVGRADIEALTEALLQVYTTRRQWLTLRAELLRLAAELTMLCGTIE